MAVVIYCIHSCSTDESILQHDSNIKTVTKERAIEFLQQNPLNLSSSKTSKTTTFFDYESITLETLTNSDQLLTVIPLAQNSKDESRRILLVQIDNKIESIIFTMFATSSANSEHFSGKIIITDLNGLFINGFSVKDGILLAKLKKKAPTNTTNRTITIDGVEFEELDEVVITNNYQKSPGKLTLLTLFDSLLQGGGGPYDGINWGFENNDGGGGSSASDPVVEEAEDPCLVAKNISVDAQSSTFSAAKTSIETASLDGLEHSITLGRDGSGNITQAPIRTGGKNYVAVNTAWSGAFAALHNHTGNTPLSAGDIYASVKLNVQSSNFTTTFVLTDGEVYGIVITNLAAAQIFVKTYPADQLPNQSPEFPKQIFDEIENLKPDMGYGIEGRTTAIAFILDKYNAGIVLLKQDSNGNFNPIKTEENIQNGVNTYTPKPCN